MLRPNPDETGSRYSALDSIRGLAAAAVVMYHCFLTLPEEVQQRISEAVYYTPLKLFVMGRPFVIVFFVLSGFVLTVSFNEMSNFSYRGFVVKRLCRIWLPYFVSILFSIAIFALIKPSVIPGLSDWVQLAWHGGVTTKIFLFHIFLSGTYAGTTLNGVNWSLVYELRISLIIPIMAWILIRFGWFWLAFASAVISAICDFYIYYRLGIKTVMSPYTAETPIAALAMTGHFIIVFAIGIILAKMTHVYRPRLAASKFYTQFAIVSLAIFLLMRHFDLSNAFGAGLLIALTISVPWMAKILESRIPKFLGKISFSLYLMHLPILMGLTHLLYGRVNQFIIIGLALVLSVGIATTAYEAVERPAMQLGRNLSKQRTELRAVAT